MRLYGGLSASGLRKRGSTAEKTSANIITATSESMGGVRPRVANAVTDRFMIGQDLRLFAFSQP